MDGWEREEWLVVRGRDELRRYRRQLCSGSRSVNGKFMVYSQKYYGSNPSLVPSELGFRRESHFKLLRE